MKLPPLPQWNNLTDDLDLRDYKKRLRDIERSMLPSDMNFPRIGEVWETIRNCDVLFRAWFTKRPGTDGKARLEQGTKVRILFIDDPKPLYVHYEPVGYRELEAGIVPEKLRSAPDYDHYELYAVMARLPCWLDKDTPFFSELFKPVEGAT